jgi:hypothetical protein
MAKQDTQPLNEAIDETIKLANQTIEQTRAEIARSQALSQAQADLAQSIDRMADDHDGGAPSSRTQRQKPS